MLAELLGWPDGHVRRRRSKRKTAALARRPRGRRRRRSACASSSPRSSPSTFASSRRPASTRSRPRRPFKYNDGVRFAALPAIMAAKKKPLVEVKLAELVRRRGARIRYLVVRAAARAQGRHQGQERRRARREADERSQGSLSERSRPSWPTSSSSPNSRRASSQVDALGHHVRPDVAKAPAARSRSWSSAPGAKAAAAELTGFGAAKVLVADDA